MTRPRFHALCPYFAMFPEAFAENWITKLSKPGDVVLDPFCGRGTTPLQALLLNRAAIANDTNPVAYCVTKAKTSAPPMRGVQKRLRELEQEFNAGTWDGAAAALPAFFEAAYHPLTLRQILYLRHVLNWKETDLDNMLSALTLGALHGESEKSPSYLSNQMSRTISMKPAYSVRYWAQRGLEAPFRDTFKILNYWLNYRYVSCPPRRRAVVYHGDFREIHRRHLRRAPVLAVTSPPYLDVTNFEEDQWLRIWFLGGESRPTKGVYSRDDRHENRDSYWRLIGDMWRSLGQVLRQDAHVVIRLGGKGLSSKQLIDGLTGTSVLSGRRVQLIQSDESALSGSQRQSFRPGASGLDLEVDCHYSIS